MHSESISAARLCRTPLAACLGMLFALGPAAPSTTLAASTWPQLARSNGIDALIQHMRARAAAQHTPAHPTGGVVLPVTSCADDGGTGTLRHVVLTASSGDTVDLSALTCSTITLTSGAVNIDVDELTIVGPGASRLAIDGNANGRIFRHSGAGTFYLSDVTVTNGSYTLLTGPYGGGCIYSKGPLSLDGVVVSSCTAVGGEIIAGGAILAVNNAVLFYTTVKDSSVTALTGTMGLGAAGGGVFAYSLTLEFSTVSGNSVSTALGSAYGGGALAAAGNLTCKYDTVSGNSVTTANAPGSGYYAIGGGLVTTRDMFIQNSTVDNNSADGGGGIYVRAYTGASGTVRNSTISGNHASLVGGGMIFGDDLTLENSTIAFNYGGSEGGGGLMVGGTTVDLESNIIADNSPSGMAAAADLDGSATITGANNIIKIAGATLVLPPDTISLDPQLGPLLDNGGLTRTLAIAPTSPAFDAGNNVAGASHDQRGVSFAREVGGSADIGAYEFDPGIIFANGFQ